MDIILASTNRAISLGSLLSRGGEGSVFLLPSMPGFVAKTYHAPLEASQQRKLKYMVGLGDHAIFSHTAWPTDCLLSADRSAVVGIVMNHIHGMSAVHMAYNAKSRLKRFPNSTWEFLLCTARNTAAAFESVHSRGHIVGDINESNILVGPSASVRLLDCDSFQVAAHGEIHSCRVGVSSFTPPELQGKSFAEIRRTSNHDGFGLAVIIFHLLFNGRHPFAGRPLRADIGGDPAENIAAFRFAYAVDNVARGLSVPPHASPLTLVPAAMRPMFHRAFTEDALRYGRPTAAEWLEAIDDCLDSVERCRRHPGHIFPGHHDKCPWCELESKGLKLFPHQREVPHPQRVHRPFNFEKWRTSLDSISIPPPVVLPSITAVPSNPVLVSPPRGHVIARFTTRVACVLVFIVGVAIASVPAKALAALASASAWLAAARFERRWRAATERDLQARLAAAQAKWAGAQMADAGQTEISRLHADLLAMKTQHTQLEKRLAGLKKAAKDREVARLLREHLIQYHVGTADIPGLTKPNRETLQSYSVWNALDVSAEKLSVVPGFGRVKVATMLEWRRQCEASFCLTDTAVEAVFTEDTQWKAAYEELRTLQRQMRQNLSRLQAEVPQVIENSGHLQRLIDQAAHELENTQREASAVVFVGDWLAIRKASSGLAARYRETTKRWMQRFLRDHPLRVELAAAVVGGCLIAVAASLSPNRRVLGPPDVIVAELESTLLQVKRAAAVGNSSEAITLIKKAFRGKKNLPKRYFREWRDLLLAGREACLQRARNLDTGERLAVEVVEASRKATNMLRLLMRELINQGERHQAAQVFTQARREYDSLLERVETDWKTETSTTRMRKEFAMLCEYDARLYKDFFALRSDPQVLAMAISKYDKCVRFRRTFLRSDAAIDDVRKTLEELRAQANSKKG